MQEVVVQVLSYHLSIMEAKSAEGWEKEAHIFFFYLGSTTDLSESSSVL